MLGYDFYRERYFGCPRVEELRWRELTARSPQMRSGSLTMKANLCPRSLLMTNRWVSQTRPKIKSSFLKIPPCIHNARFSSKILTIADVSRTIALIGTSGCPCSRKFCEAKNTNLCLRFEPRGRTHSLGQLRSSSTNQLYVNNRLQNTSPQIIFFFFFFYYRMRNWNVCDSTITSEFINTS